MNLEDYGEEKYSDHLLGQYKLYVEMADRVSQRRDQSNRFKEWEILPNPPPGRPQYQQLTRIE